MGIRISKKSTKKIIEAIQDKARPGGDFDPNLMIKGKGNDGDTTISKILDLKIGLSGYGTTTGELPWCNYRGGAPSMSKIIEDKYIAKGIMPNFMTDGRVIAESISTDPKYYEKYSGFKHGNKFHAKFLLGSVWYRINQVIGSKIKETSLHAHIEKIARKVGVWGKIKVLSNADLDVKYKTDVLIRRKDTGEDYIALKARAGYNSTRMGDKRDGKTKFSASLTIEVKFEGSKNELWITPSDHIRSLIESQLMKLKET